MDTEVNGAELAECVRSLDEEGRRAVRAYWEQVIQEEWVLAARRIPRAVSLAEVDECRAVAEVVRLAPRGGRVGVTPLGPEAA
ncbi:hypothetical protein GCM10010464_35920 [Pseudonocardia yunnanensis]|uniref:Uncharacterized protein n=1 Tax=Pseudonocardia yunnanensis TaxID=58107 RepID=A0ABW4EMH8_9PSEU